MIDKNLKQTAGNNSTNIQVAGNAKFGLSYEDAKHIALDVFNANFYELSEKAAAKAIERVQQFTDSFLNRLYADDQHDKTKLEEPAIQSAIYEAQKAFAKSGEDNLKENLLNTLLARVNTEERSMKQIILDEAIFILPKLTENEVMLLSFCVSALQVQYSDINTIEKFENYIRRAWLDFYPDKITTNEATHLLYCGCYTLPYSNGHMGFYSLGEYLLFGYKGLLTNGFSETEFETITNGMKMSSLGNFIIKNPRFPDLYQFNAINDNVFNDEINKLNQGANTQLLYKLWIDTAMKKEEVHDLIAKMDPKAKNMIETYNKTALPGFQLSPVGYAIAVLNINQKLGANLDFMSFKPR